MKPPSKVSARSGHPHLCHLRNDPLVVRVHVVDAERPVHVDGCRAARMAEDVRQALDVSTPLLPKPGERVSEEMTRKVAFARRVGVLHANGLARLRDDAIHLPCREWSLAIGEEDRAPRTTTDEEAEVA